LLLPSANMFAFRVILYVVMLSAVAVRERLYRLAGSRASSP